MAVKLGILGLGTVGTGTVQLLQDKVGRHPLLQEIDIYRVGVRSLTKPRAVELSPEVITTDLEAIVNDPAVDIVVELMGGLEPARTLILTAINNGKHVVTANKAVISRFGAEIFTSANQAGVYVLLEAAVGGGIPVIQPLKQSLSVNRISAIMGIVNGTTNYILTRMQTEGSEFDDVLADAQRLGYAEADPTADVDGLDAGDKIAILASLGFDGRINREDVYCEGIRQVTKTDIAYSAKLGFVIKLLGIAQHLDTDNSQLSVRVHPTLVPQNHPLASINGVYNAILIEGEPIGQVMLFGPGAGAGATASAVSSDILNLVATLKTNTAKPNPLLACRHQHYSQITPISELVTRFYARFLSKDQAGVIGRLGTCFGNYGVSLESVVQTGFQGELAEIVVVTHYVQEGDFRQALAEIQAMESIDSIPSVLRVL
ncbi:homoserine dehydrogenase [Aphanizomenon flos-aquae NRERC-008]|uniref:Homoserine dehydrogenase n=2 Tax=Aphanizomenon flos-aquae TaxID=1176 RepID=A0ABR8IWI4_APHFL|nr:MULTISPECIES: homoserine dehydrogenase [Aphanizomenon]MBD2392272.1 homoserine dehydrogenase [Aphanizomenon flos-aquae FACHB-1171]MBD2630328.1 homoserine dehydrogenase [Aphanizomenon sp. FACHB-1399]MBD2659015.1 homoserine dehydrogenase [Aphanizomenon flos-aquae FACHB-1265]MBD2675618.1 homoserine dehydrogenase [Aphanizomenon flos-aquae FACHB-1416]MBD2687050.1 homoserine dehydrogenase [Aphanizomenon flos-aquae FACHB-1249]MDJ0507594.1 homoserine dehydrogenase [Nostocales cyanobacterium LE14-WE